MVCVAFRGFAKSEGALHGAIHAAITQGMQILIVSETDTLAYEKITRIKKFLKSSKALERFVDYDNKAVAWSKEKVEFVDKKNPYLGEQVVLTYKIYTKVPISNIASEKEPNPSGFWMKNLIEQGSQLNQSQEIIDGEEYVTA